jgi:hypothetical protein
MGELLLLFVFFVIANAVVFGSFVLILARIRNGGPLFAVEDEELMAEVRRAAKSEALTSQANVSSNRPPTATTAVSCSSGLITIRYNAQARIEAEVFSSDPEAVVIASWRKTGSFTPKNEAQLPLAA